MNSNTKIADTYRPDIDGLRAIAVSAVMIFHAKENLLPGGFVGVDIFFVISGYLITKHIAAEISANRFSLGEFYRRRIRRIVPMMMVVVATTLLLSMLLMTPADARNVAKSAVWSIASMANIHFLRDLDSSYFAASSAEVPLLHLWSLGVEEQFYLFWPLLLVVAQRRLGPVVMIGLTLLLTVSSFELAAQLLPDNASFAYYMLPTRMGELLIGGILGLAAALTHWRVSKRLANLSGWLGMALITCSLAFIDRTQPFPGWLAVPPTLGAALVMLAGEHHPTPISALTAKLPVLLGKISYSAYLWHWPLFALFRYGYGEPGLAACAAILSTTLVLAWLSFKYIERPTRSTYRPLRWVVLTQFLLPATLLLAPSLTVVYAERIGLPLATSRYIEEQERLRGSARPAYGYDWVCQRQRITQVDLENPTCALGSPGTAKPIALLWGDSNAAHYVPMVNEISMAGGTRFRNVAVGSCPPLLVDPKPFVDASRLADCRASALAISEKLKQYPVVIISAAWSNYQSRSPTFLSEMAALVAQLSARGQTVILLGRVPVIAGHDRRCTEKALRVPFKTCPTASVPLADKVVAVNAEVRAIALRVPNVHYFDANSYLCPRDMCEQITAQGEPRYYDESHLTVAGSAQLGRDVLAGEGIPLAMAALRH